MSGHRIPLGRTESQGLEFKARDSLKDRYAIGREVVGMLNAKTGGELWVGLADQEHRAVAVEPIPDAESEARRLQDFLMDSLEPAPRAEEIEIEAVNTERPGEGVIRVAVKGQEGRQPYALLRRGARIFVLRVGDRLRPMEREEILDREARGSQEREEGEDLAVQTQTIHQLFKEREHLRRQGRRLLWLRLQPTPGGRLDLQSDELKELLTDPTRTGNRRQGANFSLAHAYLGTEPTLRQCRGETVLELGTRGEYFVRIYRDGGLELEAPFEGLEGPPSIAGHRNDIVISSVKVAEYVASVFRLMQCLLKNFEETGLWETPIADPDTGVVVQFALFGLQGIYLLSESARRSALSPWPAGLPGFPPGGTRVRPFLGDDFTLDRELIASRAEILENPDRFAFRLLRELFEAFGYPESEMPREFDRKSGRLILPE